MVELTAISSAVTSLKAIKDLASAMIGMRDAALVAEKIREMNGLLLDAQSSIFSVNEERTALIERVRELEEEIAHLKAWDAEKERYELKQVGKALAYARKEGLQGTEPLHYLCANCYQTGEKSILQSERRVPGRDEVLVCHRCGAEAYKEGQRHPEHGKPPSRRR